MYKVTNTSNTTQILVDKGKTISLEAGKTVEMNNPPEASWKFKVTTTELKEEKKSIESKGGK